MAAEEPDHPKAYRDVARLLAADARAARIDALAVRAVAALAAAGVPSLLLRGPVMAGWLYDDPAERGYADADLLVPEPALPAAVAVMRALGLFDALAGAAESERPPHARTFAGEAGSVDLHWTVKGLAAPAGAVWRAFETDAGELGLGGGRVRVPAIPVRLLIVALHAAQHGPERTARQDLERAVAREGLQAWTVAAGLAERLGGAAWFAAGLGAVPGGRELLERLRVDAALDMGAAVRAQGRVPVLGGLVALRETAGAAPRVRLLARELFPTAAFMRSRSPLARRGGLGLAAAYAARPVWLARRFPGAYRAYRRAARSVRG